MEFAGSTHDVKLIRYTSKYLLVTDSQKTKTNSGSFRCSSPNNNQMNLKWNYLY